MVQHTRTHAAPATPAGRAEPLARMDLAILAQRSLIERDRFFRREPSDDRFTHELFRRALVEGDQIAWAHLYEQYAPLVERWVRCSSAFAALDESSSDFVNAAFLRFARGIGADRFASFATLAALLNYLRSCARCVVIDRARQQVGVTMVPEESIGADHAAYGSPEETVLERAERDELWQVIAAAVHGQAEWEVVRGSFVLGMKPSAIYAQWPELFASVQEVYAVKRNVLQRLRNNPALLALLG